MIEITRGLAKHFRAVLRHSLLDQEPRGDWPLLLVRAGDQGLSLQAQKGDLAVLWHQPGKRPPEALAFRSSVLADLEGRRGDLVTLEQQEVGKGQAHWTEASVPQVLDFETVTPDGLPALPDPPGRFVPVPAGLLPALAEASKIAAKNATRYALGHVQLDGKRGELAATDGKQLLLWGGLELPWAEALRVPRLPALARQDLLPTGPARLGHTQTHVVLQLAEWTFLFRIEPTLRFPDVRGAIPSPASVTGRLHLDPDDALLLMKTLPGLPGRDEERAPVTLDLGQPPRIRASAPEAPTPTELVLSRSCVEGTAHQICLDRTYLLRALSLGFHDLEVCQPDKPVVCRQASRVYVWLPLDPKGVIAPGTDPLSVASAAGSALVAVLPDPKRRLPLMSTPPNGRPTPPPEGRPEADNGVTTPANLEALVVEVDQMRALVQEVGGRLGRLSAGLKQLRRHNRAVEQAVASLRQLQLDR